MKILVTRPLEESRATAKALGDLGYDAHIAPMFEIILCADSAPIKSNTQGIIFTSKTAVRAFCENHATRDLPAWCVGDETESAAKQAGFGTTHSADGDSIALGRKLIEEYDPKRGTLIRIAGDNTPGKLDDLLREKGFNLERHTLYQVRPIERFDEATATLIAQKAIDGVMFFSPFTAQIFTGCAAKAGLAEACRALTAWCISDETARALGALPFRHRIVAPRPTRSALLSLLPLNTQPRQAAQ